jgi:type II secretory pathway component PulC
MTQQELNSTRTIIQILQEDSNIANDHGQEAKSDLQAKQDHQESTSKQQNQYNEVSEPATKQTTLKQEVQNNKGYKIPTILNGKIVSSEVSDQQKTTRLQEKSAKYQNTECRLSGTAI